MQYALFVQLLCSYVLKTPLAVSPRFVYYKAVERESKSICKDTETGYSCHAEVR